MSLFDSLRAYLADERLVATATVMAVPEGSAAEVGAKLLILPDGTAEVRSFAVDESRNNVAAYGIFRGTHTGEGGPVPATGKSAAADYVYVMDFDGDKIRHMTKIWNDGYTLRQLGWPRRRDSPGGLRPRSPSSVTRR